MRRSSAALAVVVLVVCALAGPLRIADASRLPSRDEFWLDASQDQAMVIRKNEGADLFEAAAIDKPVAALAIDKPVAALETASEAMTAAAGEGQGDSASVNDEARFVCPPKGFESKYRVMTSVLSLFGAAMGLILLLRGVKWPKTCTLLVFAYGYGTIGYAIVWFGASLPTARWITPFAAAYLAALVLSAIFAMAVAGHRPGSKFAIILGCSLGWMIFGIMLNTFGVYRLVKNVQLPYYTFSICAGIFFALGLCVNAGLVISRKLHRRTLAMANFVFIGAYLCVKACGIIANKYPSEFCDLHADPSAGSWQYYVCVVATYVLAAVGFFAQKRLFARENLAELADDDEDVAAANVFQRSNGFNKRAQRRNPPPKHASSRIQRFRASLPNDSQQPRFGGMHANSVEHYEHYRAMP